MNADLYEVRVPAAPTAYTECEFHDSAEGAKWIVENTTKIGEAIAKGICNYLGVSYKAPVAPAEKPSATDKNDGGKLYRVQVGAFSVRANAEKMLDRLKKAGFEGYIKAD